MTVKIGSFTRPIGHRTIKLVQHADQTDSLVAGDVVQSWGHVCEWDKDCVSELQAKAYVSSHDQKMLIRLRRHYSWRQEADPVCDEALEILFPGNSSSTGADLFAALEQHVRTASSEDGAQVFYDTFSQTPPPDLCVTEEQYKIAAIFFLDHAVQISQALSYYSLAGGFARCGLLQCYRSVIMLTLHPQPTNCPHTSRCILPRPSRRA